MSEFTQEQLELMRKHNRKPDNYSVLSDTDTELILLHKRGTRWVIKKGGN